MCPNCGAPVSGADNFCETCGKPLPHNHFAPQPLVCHCPPGESLPDEEGFCQVCGVRCVPPLKSPAPAVAETHHVEESPDSLLAMVSDVGRRHRANEDRGSVARGRGGSVVMVVADGVSSSLNPEMASETAVRVIREALVSRGDPDGAASAMRGAIQAAHEKIAAATVPGEAAKAADMDGPETTVVTVFKHGRRLIVGWVGDSRAYLIDPGAAPAEELLTTDDSWAEEVVRSGEMTRGEAMADKRAHYVLQVLGMTDAPLDIHILEREVKGSEMLLLCSDGLWNYFQEPGALARALQEKPGPALAICNRLIALANQRGGSDNSTVALFQPEAPIDKG